MFNGRNFQKLDDIACILGLPVSVVSRVIMCLNMFVINSG